MLILKEEVIEEAKGHNFDEFFEANLELDNEKWMTITELVKEYNDWNCKENLDDTIMKIRNPFFSKWLKTKVKTKH